MISYLVKKYKKILHFQIHGLTKIVFHITA